MDARRLMKGRGRTMSQKTNCPNCGAPIPANGRCEYCGTVLDSYEIPVEVKIDTDSLTPLHGHDRRVRMYDPKSQMWIWVAERKKNDGEQTDT